MPTTIGDTIRIFLTALEVLPAIVKTVRGRVPVFFDGGIRRGTDILKALAFGAKAVFIGRPVIWGLAVGGEEGVRNVLELLYHELKIAMALAGVPSLRDITEEVIYKAEAKFE